MVGLAQLPSDWGKDRPVRDLSKPFQRWAAGECWFDEDWHLALPPAAGNRRQLPSSMPALPAPSPTMPTRKRAPRARTPAPASSRTILVDHDPNIQDMVKPVQPGPPPGLASPTSRQTPRGYWRP